MVKLIKETEDFIHIFIETETLYTYLMFGDLHKIRTFKETEDLIHMLKVWGLTHDTGIYRD